MSNIQCLMIKTKDQRKFFTYEKNYSELIEFSKLFNAEISVVKVEEVEILDLEQLAPAICNFDYQQNANYQILEVKFPKSKKLRKNILENAKKIKNYILEEFMKGQVVCLKELKNKFKMVTEACLCNHLSQVRDELKNKGYKIAKVGGGKYKLTAHPNKQAY